MITQQPINLTAHDLIETRSGGYHAHWPVDPDTTRRLDAVRNLDLSAENFRPRYRPRYLRYILFLAGLTGIILVLIDSLK